MSVDIRLVVDAVSNEKNVPKDIVFEAIAVALESATRKLYGATWDIHVEIDKSTGQYKTFRRWTVVSDDTALSHSPVVSIEQAIDAEGDVIHSQSPEAQMLLSEALQKKPDVVIGDVIEEEITSIEFGRIAAQTAKQVIAHRLRKAKRDQVAAEYRARVGELVNGVVKKVTREVIILELGNNAEALLKRSEMLPRESVRIGDRVRAYLQDVRQDARGPQLIISRTCPEMIMELFKIEVPEIGDGTIDIMAAARDPGSRAKIAVLAKDTRIDPVGACVGMRGSRVQAVSNELSGERVDIVLWDANPAQFVINAIAPAEVISIIIDDDERSMDIIVAESQLSAAIGRNGQNIRLASKLTNWNLNVMSEAQAEDRDQEAQQRLFLLFKENLNIEDELAEHLVNAGFTTIEEIAYVPNQALLEVEGLTEETMLALRAKAKDQLLTQALVQEERLNTSQPAADLLAVEGMSAQLAYRLASQGIVTRDDLAEQSIDDLMEIASVEEAYAGKLIMAARAHWFS